MFPTLLTAAPVAAFGVLDWTIVLLYLAAVTAIGIWARKSQATKKDYLLGGREMSWWVVGLSIVATETSAITLISIPATAFGALVYDPATQAFSIGQGTGNMFWMMLMPGYVLGRIIVAWKIIPFFYKGEVYTPYQLLGRAFGQHARTAASFFQLLAIALGAGVRVYVTAIPIWVIGNTFIASWTIAHSIVLILIGSLFYTALGGVKAVVWTDLMQYFIYVGGGLFALFYIPTLLTGNHAAPSGAEGWSAFFEVGQSHMKWFKWGWEGTAEHGGLWDLFCGKFNLVMGLIPVTLLIVFSFAFNHLEAQRLLSCRSVSDSRKAMLLSAGLIVPQFLLFLVIGVGLFAFYSANSFDFGMMPWDPLKPEKPDGNYIFPIFIVTRMPEAVRGFLIAAILSAAMASTSGALSAMGSMITMDLYRPLLGRKDTSAGEVRLSRAMTLVAGAALGVVAWFSSFSQNIIDLAFTLAALTGGGLLATFTYGFIHKRGHHVPVIAGLSASVFLMAALNFFMVGSTILPSIEIPRPIPAIAWPWHNLIGMIVCFVVIYALRPLFPAPAHLDIEKAEAEGTE